MSFRARLAQNDRLKRTKDWTADLNDLFRNVDIWLWICLPVRARD